MHNKKLKGLLAALSLCVVVGGTFAWLGAIDTEVNHFRIKKSEQSKVEILEEFLEDGEKEKVITSKTNVNKKVQVQNQSDYDSLIRVSIDKMFVDKDGKEISSLDKSKINLNYENIISEDTIVLDSDGNVTNLGVVKGKWVLAEGKYYYIGNVAPDGYTTQLLDSVSLDEKIGSNPNYQNVAFDVTIIAESVQSTKEAITTSGTDEANKNGFGLDTATHGKLIAALKAVVDGPSESGRLVITPSTGN